MAVRLEFETNDEQEIEFATRYWAMDQEGSFLEHVADILPFRELTQAGQVAKFVRQICTAYDENQICSECNGLIQIGARIDAKKRPQRARRPCKECQKAEQEAMLRQEEIQRAELEAMLAPYISHAREVTISYSELADDTVLILKAIYTLVGPRLTQGFPLSACEELTPQGAGAFIERLCEQGVLADDPAASKPGAYCIQDGQLMFDPSSASYFLPPDTREGETQIALNIMFNRDFSDAMALTELWLDYALTDVMEYFEYQCALHNHPLSDEDFAKTESIVRQGLRRYSVAQMWLIMWRVVRDAAALASRSYYSPQKAAATIPKKIHKLLENAAQGAEPSNEWNRPERHIKGALGMAFYSDFGLDEYSKGVDVLALFNRLDAKEDASDPHTLAEKFMRKALEIKHSLGALEAFAHLVREGLTTEEALSITDELNPGMFCSE